MRINVEKTSLGNLLHHLAEQRQNLKPEPYTRYACHDLTEYQQLNTILDTHWLYRLGRDVYPKKIDELSHEELSWTLGSLSHVLNRLRYEVSPGSTKSTIQTGYEQIFNALLQQYNILNPMPTPSAPPHPDDTQLPQQPDRKNHSGYTSLKDKPFRQPSTYRNTTIIYNTTSCHHSTSWDFANFIGFNQGWNGGDYNVMYGLLDSNYSMGYLQGEALHAFANLTVEAGGALFHLAGQGAELLGHAALGAAHLGGEIIQGIGTVGSEALHGIAHLGGEVLNGAAHLTREIGDGIGSCCSGIECNEDCCKCCGSTVGGGAVVAGGGASAAGGTAGADGAGTAPAHPPQPPDPSHPAHHALTHSSKASAGATSHSHHFFNISKGTIGTYVYAALIGIPTAITWLHQTYQLITGGQSTDRGFNRKRKAKLQDLTVSTTLGAGMSLIGLFLGAILGVGGAIGGPHTAVVFGIMGVYFGNKLSQWLRKRSERKQFGGITNPDKYALTREELMTVTESTQQTQQYYRSKADSNTPYLQTANQYAHAEAISIANASLATAAQQEKTQEVARQGLKGGFISGRGVCGKLTDALKGSGLWYRRQFAGSKPCSDQRHNYLAEIRNLQTRGAQRLA